MIRKLFLDTETRSPINLKTCGTVKYATESEVLIVTWSDSGRPAQCWDATSATPPPQSLLDAIRQCDEIWAHNSFFDRTNLERTKWWPRKHTPLRKWRCVMAQAFAHGLPGGLDYLCQIFRVSEDKRKLDGDKYIDLFCKPKKDGTFNDRHSHPAEWKEFLTYATRDIPAMIEVHNKIPKWNLSETEIALWHLDQQINDRGFEADVDMAKHMVRATKAEKKRLADRTQELTNGSVDRATQRDLLLRYLLLEYDVELPDMKADTIERRLEDPELPEFVKDLLRIRLQATKASTSKYQRVLQANVAGRMCGTLQYCAANRTGRWGGRIFQPQNMPRPVYKFPQIEQAIDIFKAEAEELFIDDIMAMSSSAIRSVIVAAPGKKLVVSDLSSIEGRMIAWLAGEADEVEAYRAYDNEGGWDIYILTYARAFGVDPATVTDEQRQVGKVMVLSLGYGGGVGAFVTMASTYGIDLDAMADAAWDAIPANVHRAAARTWAWAVQQKRTLGLSEKVYRVCECLKSMFRASHPKTEQYWADLEHAARMAILNPGSEFPVGVCVFDRRGNWLRIRLPSGRYLCYPNPQLSGDVISYKGVNVYNKKWHRITTYGGKIAENITQASSRDVLADAMPRAELEGYEIVLTVHDEITAECPDSEEFHHDRLSAILATNSEWNMGLPLAAKGFTSKRYKKG